MPYFFFANSFCTHITQSGDSKSNADDRMRELAKLKQQRMQRETEKRLRIEERDKMARVQTDAGIVEEDWDKFELEQQKKRAGKLQFYEYIILTFSRNSHQRRARHHDRHYLEQRSG